MKVKYLKVEQESHRSEKWTVTATYGDRTRTTYRFNTDEGMRTHVLDLLELT